MPPEEEDELAGDEDGRFFGGGVTKDTAEVLDFIDERDKDDVVSNGCLVTYSDKTLKIPQNPEKFDLSWLRKLALSFEKRISKNAELRAKFEDTPQKYVGWIYCLVGRV